MSDKKIILTDNRGNEITQQIEGKDVSRFQEIMKQFARSSFQASSKNRLNENWNASKLQINAALQKELSTIRNRCRWLAHNNTYASGAINTLKNYCIGTGFTLQMNITTTKKVGSEFIIEDKTSLNDYIEDMFNDWGMDSDYSGSISSPITFNDQQEIMFVRLVIDGEVIYRHHYDESKDIVPYSIEMIDPDMLDCHLTEYNGNPIIMGVEIDKERYSPIAYWVIDDKDPRNITTKSRRIPAEEIVHVFKKFYPRQVRGIPFLAACVEKIFQTGEYTNAQLIRNKIAAMYSVIFSGGSGGTGGFFDETLTEDKSSIWPTDINGNPVTTLAPGIISMLPDGYTVNEVKPTSPEESYPDYLRTEVQSIGTGIETGVSYTGITRDTSDTTFAGGRHQENQDIQGYKSLMRFYSNRAMSPVVKTFIKYGVLYGIFNLQAYLENSKRWTRHVWMQSGWSRGINPTQDAIAAEKWIELGITTPQDECALQGFDFDTQVRKASKAKMLQIGEYKRLKKEVTGSDVITEDEFAKLMGVV